MLAEAGVFDESNDAGRTTYWDFEDNGDDTGTMKIYEDDNAGCFTLTDVLLNDNGSGSFTMDPGNENISTEFYVSGGRIYQVDQSFPLASDQNVIAGLNMCP